jgi:hypothetical protein
MKFVILQRDNGKTQKTQAYTRKLQDQHFNTSPRTTTQISTPPYEHTIVNHIRETPTPVRTSWEGTTSSPSTTES